MASQYRTFGNRGAAEPPLRALLLGGAVPYHPDVAQQPFIRWISVVRERIADPRAYPFSIPSIGALAAMDRLELSPVTYLVGENGSGKSTLLEALAVACDFNPEGGTTNFRFSTRASESILCSCIRPARGLRRPRTGFFLRAESFFNVATEIEALDVIDSYGGRSLHEQSHGESFLALAKHRFGDEGLYFLDEPEAALSPSRQLAWLARMHALVEGGSQFVIATHSPIIMAYPGATIYSLSESGIGRIAYEDTEHVRLTRAFLGNKERMLADLFSAKDE
jgi:predicted ATPase